MTSTIIDNFISGFAYGTTNVLVGQPLDTIKTRMQALGLKSTYQTGYEIFKTEGLYVMMLICCMNVMFYVSYTIFSTGIYGLYRGGLPLFIGGG
jgi:hypothetical protein